MHLHHLTGRDWGKTLGIGLAVAILTAAVMQGLIRAGVSPLPEPLGLAFAQRILGDVPLPVGLLFHTTWVVAAVALYVLLFREALTFARAALLAVALWALAVLVFFPIVGWGVLGLAVNPKLAVAAAGVHLLFAVLLWAGCRIALRTRATSAAGGS